MNMIEKAVARAKGNPPLSASDKDGDDPMTLDLDDARLVELGLYHAGAKDAPLGEDMRAIRRRLLRRLGLSRRGKALGRRRRRNIIMVSAPQKGAGATFTALNLALGFALEDGIDALLIDASAGAGDCLHLPEGPGFAEWLAAPLEGGPDDEAVIDASDYCARANGVSLRVMRPGASSALEASSPDVMEADWPALFAEQSLGARLAGAAPEGLVIIDAPPARSPLAAALAQYVDEILMVVCAEKTRRASLVAAIDELVDINGGVSLILNRRPGGGDAFESDFYEHNQIIRAADAPPHHLAKGALSNDDIRNGIQKP